MELYLMRHGDAVAEGERPLSDRGKTETKTSAEGLKTLRVNPTLILHSPLLRAKETAEILADVFSVLSSKLLPSDLLAPGGKRELLLQELRRLTSNERDEIVLVGHLPDLGELITYLVWGEPVKEIPLKKSGVALVECTPSTLQRGKGILRWLLTAEHLRLIASAHPE